MIKFRVRVTKYHIRDPSNGDSDVGDVFLMFLTEPLVVSLGIFLTNTPPLTSNLRKYHLATQKRHCHGSLWQSWFKIY